MLPADIFTRISLWQDGIDAWAKGTVKDRVFRHGFRGSFELTSDNSAWITQHNVYIAILSDFGVIGATLFVISLLGGLIQIGSKSIVQEEVGKSGGHLWHFSPFST